MDGLTKIFRFEYRDSLFLYLNLSSSESSIFKNMVIIQLFHVSCLKCTYGLFGQNYRDFLYCT